MITGEEVEAVGLDGLAVHGDGAAQDGGRSTGIEGGE